MLQSTDVFRSEALQANPWKFRAKKAIVGLGVAHTEMYMYMIKGIKKQYNLVISMVCIYIYTDM